MAEEPTNPPAYVRFDQKQREEFLSQYGVTSSVQRELFHQLCNSWRPEVDFDQFVVGRRAQFDHVEQEVESLVNRLKTARMAHFIFRKNEKGERLPKGIVLCDEGSDRYWFHFLQDLIQRACDNPRNPFLTLNLLKSRDVVLPPKLIEVLEMASVAKTPIEALAKTEKLLMLTLQAETVMATSQTLSVLLTFASSKLRYLLKNPEVTAAASRLLNLGLNDVTKRLDDKDSGFWRGLAETLLLHRDDLLADRRLHLDLSFFQAAELFFTYLTNQLEEQKKVKEQAQERETDMREIEQLVLHEKEILLPSVALESHLTLLFKDKYGQEFEDFREQFMTQFTQAGQKSSLAPLVVLGSGVVHRNNLYKHFLSRFDSLQTLANQEFLIRMSRRMRQPNNSQELAFLNPENMDQALREWTEKNDAVVHELLSKHKLLAEALIHHGRTNLGLASVDDMRDLMIRFFRPGVMTLRRYQEMYGLDVQTLYEEAFRRLSVFSQFWRRLTGRYRIQAEEFRALALPKERKQELAAEKRSRLSVAGAKDELPIENLSPEEKKKRRQEWRERKQSAPSPSKPKETSPVKPAPVKQYNEKERETAWSSFKDTVKKD
jgi:hypothetical protein